MEVIPAMGQHTEAILRGLGRGDTAIAGLREARLSKRGLIRSMNPSSSLQLGDGALDQDHARLHELIEQLLHASSATVLATLDELRVHARGHFSVEDADLRVMNDGNAKCHIDEHGSVQKSLDEVRDVLIGDEADAKGKALLVQRLALQLLGWLPEHVHGMDAGVATHRSKQRFGGAPVAIQKRPR